MRLPATGGGSGVGGATGGGATAVVSVARRGAQPPGAPGSGIGNYGTGPDQWGSGPIEEASVPDAARIDYVRVREYRP